MAAIIEVSPGVVWSSSSWMFRLVLRSIAAETADGDLAANLTEIVDANLPGLSLPELADAQRSEVERIIRDRLVARTEQELPATTQNRAKILDYVRGLAEVLDGRPLEQVPGQAARRPEHPE
jgi:hypothetical protein